MKRILSFVLSCFILCTLASSTFAAQITDGGDVVAKYVTNYEGENRADVAGGEANVGGIHVTGAPENAVTLVVIPMEGEALNWIDGCVEGDAAVAYDIHFLDADGNRINANGAKVSIAASGSNLTVSSVNTSGENKYLTAEIAGGKVSFATDGSHYYVVAQKRDGGSEEPGHGDSVTIPVRGDENTLHADVTYIEEDTVKLEELDFEEIDHVVGDHVGTGIVEIDLTGLGENVTKVVLPVNTVKHIAEAAEEAHNDTEALQVDFFNGSVKLDDKTMRAIVEQAEGNEVLLVLENVGETRLNNTQENALADKNVFAGFEAYMVCESSNKRISDFEGGVATLSVLFTVPDGYSESDFAVWHVADNGVLEKLTSWFSEGKLYWDVGHFSDFIVTYEGELPHEHSYSKKVTTPTCTEKGYSTYTCSCGDSYVADYTDATGHSFTKYASNKDATCKKDGTETAKCDRGCGVTDTRTEKGSKLGHDYVDGKCTRCGATNWIPQTGDQIMMAVVTLVVSGGAILLLLIWKRKKR